MNDAIPVIDTHQHLIYPDRFNYAWTNEIEVLSKKGFDLNRYAVASANCGIAKTIFMETAPEDWAGEAGFVEKLAADSTSSIAAIIANCRPESDGFDRYIDGLSHHSLIVGVRRILHVEPDELSQTPTFVENIRKLAARNLTFDLCVLQRQLPIARLLVERCEAIQFVLDHCGVPDIASGNIELWRHDISELARLPNIACKISGLLTYAPPGKASIDTVRPYVEHCLEMFGWDRVIWGSDWPVVNINSDLRLWLEMTREIVRDASASAQLKLFYENAATIYSLEV